ncbi:MAG: glycoside hydrolase family 125 protein, partial [Sphaerochaeta sp.]|nr:glycoside hydrolase family 125 protein [Sphaerochaeta sp.]
SGFPVLALAPITSSRSDWVFCEDPSISFTMDSPLEVPALGNAQFAIYWGVGFEEVSAVTTAREFSRQGVEALYKEQVLYLDSIIRPTGDREMDKTLFSNLLFAIHYATGRTIDSEELVLVTSRSPRYYVSAAYWDRDSLLWSFPAILEVDQALAREMLYYVSTRQKWNVGIHSRYIDGTILEPGFELDELCAPILSIDAYIKKTSEPILEDSDIKSLTNRIIDKLEAVETETGLYKTFLQPTDDMHVYPLLTYNNALVHAVFSILASWNWNGKASHWAERKEAVKRAIEMHLVKDHHGKRQYVWSTDGNGNYDIYDEPPGSLLLLPLFGIASLSDEVYLNTVSTITDPAYEYSFAGTKFAAIGCPHAPHPWILSLANEVRVLHTEAAIQKLLHAPMDHGIACESIDEHSGYASTGEAFATCAGYLAYVLIGEMKARGKWKA